MSEFLRDSIWTFIGAVIAVFAIVVSVLIYLGQKQRKRLRVERIAGLLLARSGLRSIDGLQITFKGKNLDRPSIIVAKISNPGNTHIQSADFESPITLQFEPSTEILEASVIETQPNGIPVIAEIKGTSAVLHPHLLNSGDVVVMRILLAAGKSQFTPFARIAGVASIETRASISLWQPILGLLSFLMTVTAVLLSPASKGSQLAAVRIDDLPYRIIAGLGMLLIMGIMVFDLQTRIRRMRERQKILA